MEVLAVVAEAEVIPSSPTLEVDAQSPPLRPVSLIDDNDDDDDDDDDDDTGEEGEGDVEEEEEEEEGKESSAMMSHRLRLSGEERREVTLKRIERDMISTRKCKTVGQVRSLGLSSCSTTISETF